MPRTAKPGKCKHCRQHLERVGQKLHEGCVAPWWEANREKVQAKAAAKAKRAEREQTKARRVALETIPELIAAAQKEFNAYIRARDAGQPCICCGRTTNDKDLLTGSRWDAGHYRSTGSASHLRFNEDNCHRQLVHCNRHGAGRAVDYRIGLVARIGLARVEALEANNAVHKWTADELRAIRATYRAKLKQLKEHA
jgi:hypothetical protein